MSEKGDSGVTNATLAGLNDTEVCQYWTKELGRTKRYFTDWWDTADNIYDRYRDERVGAAYYGRRTSEGGRLETKRFNILWSNVKTLFPALYTGPPSPVVKRRFKDTDPMARLTVELTERSLEYIQDPAIDLGSYDGAARNGILDYLLVGRGVVWQRYEKETEEVSTAEASIDPDSGEEVSVVETETRTLSENVFHDHVQYRDFMHNVAPTWDQVQARGWVARCLYMTKPEVKAMFGEEAGREISLTANDTTQESKRSAGDPNRGKPGSKRYAEVWEIWNVPDKKVYFHSRGYKGMLKAVDNPEGNDPLNLRNFFPCPKPLYATTTPDTLIPVADYVQYYDQAQNLDMITNQKWTLTTALRVAGLYAGKEGEKLQQLFDGSNRNTLIPVQDWAQIKEGGGVAGLVTWVPLDIVAQALAELQRQEEGNKNQIYEITGIADIIRGQSKASETLGAQRLKGQWASVRLSDRQKQVGTFTRDMLRIDAEIVAEHYEPETIAEMTNFANSEFEEQYGETFLEAVALMRDDKGRYFRVDVETEDTVFADETQERGQNVEMLGAMGQFMSSAMEIGMANPLAIPVLGEMLKIGLKSFTSSASRDLEGYVDEMVAQMDQAAEEARNAPPQPTEEEIKAEGEEKDRMLDAQDKAEKNRIDEQGQVLDFRAKTVDQALEKRKQDLQFSSQNKDRLAQLLARAGNA